ncbi:MAG: sigma-70 family RNA polymerase sigma factor [Myxococcaceae bacterium]|nr:sigma-70 family RNA polymerase sigma factor [Myxococcaceae bacterium]MCA3015748.1 sigma-70 family RNA polymerase sigma factor [Myxococcaceae bacterium]
MSARPQLDGDATIRLEDFDRLYAAHAPFVWKTLRGLGVARADVDDAAQEVFLAVYRKLGTFEGRSSLRTWLCGIAVGIARNHTRKTRRREAASEQLPSPGAPRTGEATEALDLVGRCLDELDEPLRMVFVLAELQQLTAPEVAEVLTVNVNTVYSRLRLARERFEASVARHGGAR